MNLDQEGKHPIVKDIVDKIKSEGIFDELRKECLADVDTKPGFENLRHNVENACARFLSRIAWSTSLNKIQLRDQMTKNLEESGILLSGVKRLVNQVVRPRIDKQVKPKVAQVVCEHLGLNPEDILGIEQEQDFTPNAGVGQFAPAVSLYPFNPYHAPILHSGAATAVPPPLPPGFDDHAYPPPLPAAPPLPPTSEDESVMRTTSGVEAASTSEGLDTCIDKERAEEAGINDDDDMEISEKSDSRSTSRVSSKHDVDIEDQDVQTGDLSKGLAAYMAASSDDNVLRLKSENDADDMSISSVSSKTTTPEPVLADALSTTAELSKSKAADGTSKDDTKKQQNVISNKESLLAATGKDPSPPMRRQMKRQRTRNKKYMSDDFLSIFTEQTDLLSRIYGDGENNGSEVVLEEEVVVDTEFTGVEQSTTVSGSFGLEPVVQLEPIGDESKESKIMTVSETTSRPASVASSNSSSSSGKSSGIRNRCSETPKPRRRSLRQQQKRGEAPAAVIDMEQIPSTDPLIPSADHSIKSTDSNETVRTHTSFVPTLSVSVENVHTLRSGRKISSQANSSASCSQIVTHNQSQSNMLTHIENMEVCNSSDSSQGGETPTQDEIPVTSNDSISIHLEERTPVNADACIHSVSTLKEREQLSHQNALSSASFEKEDRLFTSAHALPDSVPPEFTDSSHCATQYPYDKAASPIIDNHPADPVDFNTDTGPSTTESILTKQPEYSPSSQPAVDTSDSCNIDERSGVDCVMEAEIMEDRSAERPVDDGEQIENTQSETAEYLQSDNLRESPVKSCTGEESPDDEEIAGDENTTVEDGEVEAEDDIQELERLAQKKLEILKAIEMPDSLVHERGSGAHDQSSEEEEGEITDSSSEEERRRKKKSKKSKKKKSKSRKHKRRAPSPSRYCSRSPSPSLKRRRLL